MLNMFNAKYLFGSSQEAIWGYCWHLQWERHQPFFLSGREISSVQTLTTGRSSVFTIGERKLKVDGHWRSLMEEAAEWINQVLFKVFKIIMKIIQQTAPFQTKIVLCWCKIYWQHVWIVNVCLNHGSQCSKNWANISALQKEMTASLEVISERITFFRFVLPT